MLVPQQIKANLEKIRREIQASVQISGRHTEEVRLIAVSKTFPAAAIEAAMAAGQWQFGENRVQEALEKIPLLSRDIEWHLVGHLQKNKARHCPGKFQWIHSIDSSQLVDALEKRCQQSQSVIKVLIQVNLSRESSKWGIWEWDELCRLVEHLLSCQCLQLKGLMTMADHQANEKETRKIFATLYQWRERLIRHFGIQKDCTELSMGMSSDYKWAIEEGATFIRIGSAIFGRRP